MNGYINKRSVTAFILGIIFVVFLFHAYIVYQNRAAIAEIVNFINSAQQQAPAQPAAQQ